MSDTLPAAVSRAVGEYLHALYEDALNEGMPLSRSTQHKCDDAIVRYFQCRDVSTIQDPRMLASAHAMFSHVVAACRSRYASSASSITP